jgi:creatinine amidohydrolase
MPEFTPRELEKIFPNGFPGWDVEHASIMETSMMYVIRPELVRRDKIVDDEAKRHPGWDVVPAPDDFIPKSGVLWHPSEATEETGRLLIEAAVKRLVTAIRTELL